jgi:hypothetical protein
LDFDFRALGFVSDFGFRISDLTFRPAKIVSGGQTGVDRAALDVAIELRIPHGGWCPKGRLAEDGAIPRRYRLTETELPDYVQRTGQNVLDADATLILCRGQPSGGTDLTRRLAQRHRKPHLVVDLLQGVDWPAVYAWLAPWEDRTLNVAGPRESQCPGIHDQAAEFLREMLGSRGSET